MIKIDSSLLQILMVVTTKPELVPVIIVQQSEDIFFVLFDQEITSLRIDSEIYQITALSLLDITKVRTCFILPHENIDQQAFKKFGLDSIVIHPN